MNLSDASHVDPCRKCRGLFLRGDMTPANKIREETKRGISVNPKARGYYCSHCFPKTPDGKP